MDEHSLRCALKSADVAQIEKLLRIVGNIVEHPNEAKFRTLRMENPIVKSLLGIHGVDSFLRSAGFSEDKELPRTLIMAPPSDESIRALDRELLRLQYELSARHAATHPVASCAPPKVSRLAEPGLQNHSKKLVVFDFDSTLTVDSDCVDYGLGGKRLDDLLLMVDRLMAADACTVLVTAQRRLTTEIYTVNQLRKSGLYRLFCTADLPPQSPPEAMFYRDNPTQGAIYTGAEAMQKISLISKIMAGENRWRLVFAPSNVLFVDDRWENLRGHEALGIEVLHVRQDGMSCDDMERVLEFCQA
eukprot:TRINITY_DN21507_c0_g1_i1.p1 TRINITY_DN21507_c0_g1~~TRINITY_DN21507_c0_g1_i1.p1  ORF type:complete len:302 (-),score=39.90 TRINITY_DN21507_c0_g1_i1:10-915(-)